MTLLMAGLLALSVAVVVANSNAAHNRCSFYRLDKHIGTIIL